MASADPPVPPGVYFHAFTGSKTGSEWSTWRDLGAPNRFEFSDLPADGFYPATVNTDGTFVFDGAVGSGSFHPDGSASIDFQFGPFTHFHSEIHRAPYTDADFPVTIASPVSGDPSLVGTWQATILSVDPDTGATLAQSTGEVYVAVFLTFVRLDLPDGSWYQGVWRDSAVAGVRVISPVPSNPNYVSFPGSQASVNQNVVGEVRVNGPESMDANLLLQTIAPFGQQVQSMIRLELTRILPPACAGDVNGDGLTNSADFNILAGAFGSAVAPGTSGDVTGDGVVNSADFNVVAGDFGCGG